MGENGTITNMMKTIVAGTSLEESHKNSRITVQERQQSASSRKQTLNAQILSKSQATEAYSPLTIKMKPTRKTNNDSLLQYPNEIMKSRHWEKANGSFRHHNNCGNTRAGKQECARTTHISRPIDDSVERKPVLAINCRFQAQNFLRESNHDEVLGTDHDEHVQQLLSVSHHWPIEANSWDFKTAAQFL